jgi:hypothetical protein
MPGSVALTSIGFFAKPLGKPVEMYSSSLASFGSPGGFSGNRPKKPILVRECSPLHEGLLWTLFCFPLACRNSVPPWPEKNFSYPALLARAYHASLCHHALVRACLTANINAICCLLAFSLSSQPCHRLSSDRHATLVEMAGSTSLPESLVSYLMDTPISAQLVVVLSTVRRSYCRGS